MKSTIEEMYYGNVSGNDIKTPKNMYQEEYKLYEDLTNKLSTEDNDMFNKFVELYAERLSYLQCKTYKLGFTTGFKLGVELSTKEEL